MSQFPNLALDLSQLPALALPPGLSPNFIDPYTRGPQLLALSTVALVFMYCFVAVRFYSKFHIKNEWTWDDVTCALAALGSTELFVVLSLDVRAGMGPHQWNVRASRVASDLYLKPFYLMVNTSPLVALFVKQTFLLLYLRIFRPKTVFRWSIYLGIAVTAVFYLVITMILFILSTPKPGTTFAENFANFVDKQTTPVLDTSFAMGYFNIFSDIYILILPISAVLGLNLPKRRKFGISLIFMAGILAVCCSTVSLVYRYRMKNTGDTTWEMMPVGYLTILELTIGIDCSCVPACSIVIHHHLPKLVSSTSNVTSRLRNWSVRLLPSRGSRSQHLRLNEIKKSGNDQQQQPDIDCSGSGDDFKLRNLPKIFKKEKTHRMRRARDFFWRSRTKTRTDVNDIAENDAYLYLSGISELTESV